ncbi:hypothetical protein TREES_T100014311 [Tupaia chinensis]|uniref:Uncharacterized protein n=1 Tax=Tupaia chinensis TaxID=246437 RepID=L9JI78_TUPCH|nr:hypothetical protein TREES_T100014311 [Tupaia chinensis]
MPAHEAWTPPTVVSGDVKVSGSVLWCSRVSLQTCSHRLRRAKGNLSSRAASGNRHGAICFHIRGEGSGTVLRQAVGLVPSVLAVPEVVMCPARDSREHRECGGLLFQSLPGVETSTRGRQEPLQVFFCRSKRSAKRLCSSSPGLDRQPKCSAGPSPFQPLRAAALEGRPDSTEGAVLSGADEIWPGHPSTEAGQLQGKGSAWSVSPAPEAALHPAAGPAWSPTGGNREEGGKGKRISKGPPAG